MKLDETGYCGYRCAYCAAGSKDEKEREELIEGWRRIFGYDFYTVENVLCNGCRSEGPVADKGCQVRECASSRGVGSCALCEDFICERLSGILSSAAELVLRKSSEGKRISAKDYHCCLAQFDGISNLLEILREAGRIGDWVEEVIGRSGGPPDRK